MNIDYQVLTIKNQIKSKDIAGLGVELNDRKGSGNYDKERTKFNIEYVGFNNHSTLSSKVYETIHTNNIEFNKSENTNILNGCIITSGPEFFKKLGLPMKNTGRVHIEGNHIGEPIFCPDIKVKEDIPKKILDYFNESYEFISNYVGKENIIYAGVHFDEDTPHMHLYWIPVVDHVKRKVFETDSSNKRITKQIYTKDNIIKNVPIQKKDENGKNVYEVKYGKFLNSDEFWKQRDGKASYAKLQDNYNEFIKSKGFNLDRGKIGLNKHHQDKAEHNIKVLNHEIDKLTREIEIAKSINEIELKAKNELKNLDEEIILNPTKDFLKRYKDKDIEKLINYSKDIKKENITAKKESNKKSMEIEKLKNQINQFQSGDVYKDKDQVIAKQEKIINEQKNIIENLTSEIKELKEKIQRLNKIVWTKLNDAYLAVAHLLGFKDINKNNVNHDILEYKVQIINEKYDKSAKERSKDYEL